MHQDYNNLFSHLKPAEPSNGLFDKIIARFKQERSLIIKRRLILFSVGLVSSVVAFIPAGRMVRTGLIESGFIQYFSLIFSDFGVVTTYWQNFSLTLLESIPVISLVLFLTITLLFLESLKFFILNLRIILRRQAVN